MDFLHRAYLQLAERYRSMTPSARLAAGLLAAVVVLSIGYLIAHPTVSPKVDLMYGLRLAADQLPAMETAFGNAKLKGYKIRGTSIFVPQGQESEYMAALAAADALPPNFGDAMREAVNGDSVFDFGPQRDRRMCIAKQTDLARVIRQMPGIASASVIYDVESRAAPFKDKNITASVMVKPAESVHLDKQIVSAIRTMVAHSFAGLKPENVAVTDLNARRTWYGNLENEPDAADAVEPATVTTFPDVHTEAPPPETPPQGSDWAIASWQTLAGVVLALVGLLALRSMVRSRPVAADTVDQPPGGNPAVIPRPHAEGFFEPSASLREELSELVKDDPDAAAGVLRSWIGEVK